MPLERDQAVTYAAACDATSFGRHAILFASSQQSAAQALLLVAERGGPTMLARIGVMRAVNTAKPNREITPRRKRAKRYRIVR